MVLARWQAPPDTTLSTTTTAMTTVASNLAAATLHTVTSHSSAAAMTGTATSSAATSTATGSAAASTPTSSPLLFFVALGFGVVFTNLWIIVGVKYCFRYNSRNRQLRMAGEAGDGIDLNALGSRPQRRRREKKLMSMEEVNERFPLVKYKVWKATREQEGMPSAGGITAPGSRAPSIMGDSNLGRVSSEQHDDDDKPQEAPVADTSSPPHANAPEDARDFGATESSQTSELAGQPSVLETETPAGLGTDAMHTEQPQTSTSGESNVLRPTGAEAEEDEDDPIRTAVPTELLAEPGDACAICLDNIDDNDDVRGLTCGHAFHAGCLDPWLTSRRACCPLCKADYYVPKPRPEGEQAANSSAVRRPSRAGLPGVPQSTWLGSRGGVAFRPRVVVVGNRVVSIDDGDHHHFGFPSRARRSRPSDGQAADQTTTQEPGAAQPSNWRTRAMTSFRNFHTPLRPSPRFASPFARAPQVAPQTEDTDTTPAQLEAGRS